MQAQKNWLKIIIWNKELIIVKQLCFVLRYNIEHCCNKSSLFRLLSSTVELFEWLAKGKVLTPEWSFRLFATEES